jgi:hypothetical protein
MSVALSVIIVILIVYGAGVLAGWLTWGIRRK